MSTVLALLIVVGIALVMEMVGLSPALGTFLAGVVLANSEFRHELESDIEPFKGLLLGLFFITVGAGIDFAALWDRPLQLILLTLLLMLLKGAVLYPLGRLFRLRGRDAWLFTLGLAQAGEFGFVLVSFALQQRVIFYGLGGTLLLVIALSMLLTPLFFVAYDLISKRLGDGPVREADPIDETHPILIAGIGRFGQVVNRLVTSSGFHTTVLDNDLDTVEVMRNFGFKSFYGDPTRPEILSAAGIDKAGVLVAALDDRKATLKLVTYARKRRPDLFIIARAYDRVHTFELHRAGADKVVREVFDSSLRAGRYVLEQLGLSEYEAHEAEQTFYRVDRHAIQELAELWDPNLPVTRNRPYLDRAREMNKELESALMNLFTKDDQDAA